ncbi:MAG: alpha/beta fold hydrolase [Pseudomonadota bacterium]
MIPLVLVPGHLCDARLYAPQIAALPADVELRIADTGRDATLFGMAERILSDVPGRFMIAGLSLGGMVAMEAMAAAPDRVLGAGLWSTDPLPASEKEVGWRAHMKKGVTAEGLDYFVGRFAANFYRHDAELSARLLPDSTAMMLEAPLAMYLTQSDALDTRRDMRQMLDGWAGPVELAVGTEDRICPPAPHHDLAARLPGAALTEIPGCGHISTLEAPEAVNVSLLRLIDRVRSSLAEGGR